MSPSGKLLPLASPLGVNSLSTLYFFKTQITIAVLGERSLAFYVLFTFKISTELIIKDATKLKHPIGILPKLARTGQYWPSTGLESYFFIIIVLF